MATKKITELDTIQTLNNEDLLSGVDVSEDKTVKVFFSDFKNFVVSGVQADVDQLDQDLQDALDNIAQDFANYYTKTQTYTKQEVNALVDVIPRFSIEVVEELPEEDISTTTIYLVPSEDPEENNSRDEYIYVNEDWELIGSTKIDLSNYYTKSEIDNIVSSIDTDIDNLQNSIDNIDVGVKTANGTTPDTNGDLKLKTINNNSILGEGNITISGGGGSSEIIMIEEEPTEDTKLYIEEYDIDTGDVIYEELPVGTILDFDESEDIPTGWEETDDDNTYPNIYSSEETRIGTWFEKPLYRKTFSGNTPSSALVDTAVISNAVTNLEFCTNLYGYIVTSFGFIFINSAIADKYGSLDVNNICTSYINTSNNQIRMSVGEYLTSLPFSITIEYTKAETTTGGAN